MSMNIAEKSLARRVAIARQKGAELKLNPILIRETERIRKLFGIPDTGFANSIQSLKWQQTTRRLRLHEWCEEIETLRLKLGKEAGWKESLEKYFYSNRLVAPLYSVRMRYHLSLDRGVIGRSVIVLDDPTPADFLDMYKHEQKLESIPTKSIRLYPFEAQEMIYELSKLRPKINDATIAKEVNRRFNTIYSYKDVSDIRRKFSKKFMSNQ